MIGRSIGFTRWYDRIPELAQAVRMLEKMPASTQRLVATIIIGSVQLHQLTQQSEHGLKKLGTEKVIGLMKSKGKRRWYDQDPVVHQAFNYLYLMDDEMRHETAIKMIISMRAIEESSRKGASPRTYTALAKSIFGQQLQKLLTSTEFYVQEQVETDPAAAPLPLPPTPPQPSEQHAAGAIDSSPDEGMKLIRLKKSL